MSNGTKRHLAVDVLGLLLTVLVTASSVQDRAASSRVRQRPPWRYAGEARCDTFSSAALCCELRR